MLSLNAKQIEIQNELVTLRAQQVPLERALEAGAQQSVKELQEIEDLLKAASESPPAAATNDGDAASKLLILEARLNQYSLTQRRTLLQTRQQVTAVFSQLNVYQKRLDLNRLKVADYETQATQVTEAVASRRKKEAEQQAKQATDKVTEIKELFPLLAKAEQANVEITEKIKVLEDEAVETLARDRKIQEQLVNIATKFRDTKNKLNYIEHSTTFGAMLRKRKSELPNPQFQQQLASEAQDRIEEIQYERFEIAEQLETLSTETIFKELIDEGVEISDADRKRLADPVTKLADRRRESLRSINRIYDRLFGYYAEIETSASKIAKAVDQFSEFINERILWLRSNNLLYSEWEIDKADKVLLSADKWGQFWRTLVAALKKHPLRAGVGVLLLVGVLVLRPRSRKTVDELGVIAARGSCTDFWPTRRTTVVTILNSLTIPLAIFGVGWVFGRSVPSGSVLFDATAHALQVAGLFAIPIEFLRRACRPKGLAVCHFDWPEFGVAKLRRNLTWLLTPMAILVYCVSLMIRLDSAHRVDLIERTLFLAAMVLLTIFLFNVFSPRSGVFSPYVKRNENSWVHQTSSIWFSAILLVPISLSVLTISGYYYSAINLSRCLCFTLAFGVVIELVRELVQRFILVRRRSAHIEKAKRKREAEIEAAKEARKQAAIERQRRIDAGEDYEEDTTPVVTSESLKEIQLENLDIDANAGQASQLIRLLGWTAWLIGLWIVWSDVLPAIRALDDIKLWGSSVATQSAGTDLATAALLPGVSTGSNDSADGDAESTGETDSKKADSPLFDLNPANVDNDDRVSLRDFLVFIVIVLLTFFAARNLPNAFEMLFLDELPVDRSARYASKALFSYGVVVIGTLLALKTLSINWTSIQWLVTALTFGLAFGLQEIFANFVAGVILMFERPMRIGDLITVDEFTGVVTRIRTRATTIVNWDRKEYVIPNKDFITGRLVNWTLSDAINRIQFTVGIAYGSDVAKAKKLIFDICKEHPNIVQDPPTSITFEEFADSSLNIVVRTFLGNVDSRLPVIDALHSRINSTFNEAGIEIAFPQQDLHVRGIDEDVAALFRARKES